jgi:outer membrane biosynthesis protein TonB
MIAELITLPLRLTFRTASFFLRGSEEVLKRAFALTGRSAEATPRYGGEDNLYDDDAAAATSSAGRSASAPSTAATSATPQPSEPEPTHPEREPAAEGALVEEPKPVSEAPPIVEEPKPVSEAPPIVEEPTHVSEEPTIVVEFAEAGAEEGAGPQITIGEPWDGYARMSAKDVIARVGDADAAELAAVSLYESANQARQTVLAAVERQLALARRSGTSNG